MGKQKPKRLGFAENGRDWRGPVSYRQGMPEWSYEDLQGKSVEFRISSAPFAGIGEFKVSRGPEPGKFTVEIEYFVPDPFRPLGGMVHLLKLHPLHIARIQLHPDYKEGETQTGPKFLMLA